MGWFSRKKRPAGPFDMRNWNEDWKVGDTAECIVGFDAFHDCVKPWHRPAKGAQFTVVGFSEAVNSDANILDYYLSLKGWPVEISTRAFRKVRPVTAEKSEVAERILNLPADKLGTDKVREPAHTSNPPHHSTNERTEVGGSSAPGGVRPFMRGR